MDHVHSWHGQNIFSNTTGEDILGLPFVDYFVLGEMNPKLCKKVVFQPMDLVFHYEWTMSIVGMVKIS
jgi:hypothetical protein